MAADHATASPAHVPRRAAAIIFAVAIEADAFARRATNPTALSGDGLTFHEGDVAGHRVAWCVAGAGSAAAGRAAQRLIDGHRPRLIISAGFAGGLDAALARGAVVKPTRVVDAGGERPIALGLALQPATETTIVTVDQIVATAAAKRDLASRFNALLVDMETHAVAEVAATNGLPCLAVRVISDTASQELPREVARLAAPQSPLRRLGAAVGAIGRRPAAAMDLWRLWEHAVVDGRTLAAALVETISSLPRDHGPE